MKILYKYLKKKKKDEIKYNISRKADIFVRKSGEEYKGRNYKIAM